MQRENRVPVVTIVLVLINSIIFALIELSGSSYDTDHMIEMGAMYEPLIVQNQEYYRLITHFFLHFGIDHLVNNMISLLVLGYALENVIGRLRFTILYFLSGILAGVTSIVYNIYVVGGESVSCGASGAIYGLTGALLILLIVGNRGKRTAEVGRYMLYVALSLYSGFQDTSIDNAAHVGGFIAGLLICLLMSLTKRMEVSYEG